MDSVAERIYNVEWKTMKIWSAGRDIGEGVPGTIVKVEKIRFWVQTKDGC
jgi:hypothetical protein